MALSLLRSKADGEWAPDLKAYACAKGYHARWRWLRKILRGHLGSDSAPIIFGPPAGDKIKRTGSYAT
jgi:hypothetical protein